MRLFRERLLARLVGKHALSRELATKLLSWRHPGFSAHVGEPIAPENTQAIEDMAGYVTRNPLSLKRLVYVDGRWAVIYKALKPNPTLGGNVESLDFPTQPRRRRRGRRANPAFPKSTCTKDC